MDDSREEFVSNVSHELKTPMTSMKVLADSLLEQENLPVEMYQEFMGDIAKEIDRENKIINDLLSLVKMDKSAGNINITSVQINELLERIIAKLNYVIAHSAQVTQSAKSAECLSLEAMRLTNELNRKMNDPNISSDYLLKLIKRCAQEKYNALQNQSVGWQNELLKKELESRSPSESLDVQLFQKVVYKVLIAYDTTVTLQLINRKNFLTCIGGI